MSRTINGPRLTDAERPRYAEARSWIGRRVIEASGRTVGRLEDVWVDPESGEPSWLLLRVRGVAGLLRHRLVPFRGATSGGDHVWVPARRSTIRDSPKIEPFDQLTPEGAERLRRHYRRDGH